MPAESSSEVQLQEQPQQQAEQWCGGVQEQPIDASVSHHTKQTYKFFGFDIPCEHFDEKFGSYWGSILAVLATGTGWCSVVIVTAGRLNGWPVVYVVPSVVLWVQVLVQGLAVNALPCAPPSVRHQVCSYIAHALHRRACTARALCRRNACLA